MAMTYVCAFSAIAMTGLVWFVQVVHYPLFRSVGEDAWTAYHALHTRRTGWVVAPLMIAELGSATWLVIDDPRMLTIVGVALAAATWVLTFALAVPGHDRLAQAWDAAAARRLVAQGWLRTAAWTAHGVVALALIT